MNMLVERLIELAAFALETVIVVIGLFALIGLIFNLVQKGKKQLDLEIENLNQRWTDFGKALKNKTLTKKELKAEKKEKKKKKKNPDEPQPHIFVLDFEGDMKAHAVEHLREEVTAVLAAAAPQDEVVLRLESPGGVVHGYGLAAAQLQRFKKQGLKLTVCVDKVAASGGYMMACVADRIVAAPFAILGSIGVLAQVPNFHRLLKKHDIDYREITSGEYKRTISLLGEITEKGEQKFTEQIGDTHLLFKNFVHDNRPQASIDQVSTGEYWFGVRAKELGLVDDLLTSDEYLMSLREKFAIRKIKYEVKPKHLRLHWSKFGTASKPLRLNEYCVA